MPVSKGMSTGCTHHKTAMNVTLHTVQTTISCTTPEEDWVDLNMKLQIPFSRPQPAPLPQFVL